jgi:hypothetical protein
MILPDFVVFAEKPGNDPLGGFDLGVISLHPKSPFLQLLSEGTQCSRIGNPGKENLPGTCRRAHPQFEAFFRSFPEAGGRKCRSLDIARTPAITTSRITRRFWSSRRSRPPASIASSTIATTRNSTGGTRSSSKYAIAAWKRPNRILDGLFGRLRGHFSEAQIVELTLRITLCGFFNKFSDALEIEDEAEAVERLAALTASAGLPDAGHPA